MVTEFRKLSDKFDYGAYKGQTLLNTIAKNNIYVKTQRSKKRIVISARPGKYILSSKLKELLESTKHPLAHYLLKCELHPIYGLSKLFLDVNSSGLIEVTDTKKTKLLTIGKLPALLFNTEVVVSPVFNGKWINTDILNPYSVESLVNAWKYLFNKENDLVVYDSLEKIQFCYLESNYAAHKGLLGGSCMRGAGSQPSFAFYSNHGVKLVALLNKNGKVAGRALLWENIFCKELKKEITVLDRIYTNDDCLVKLFRDFAVKNKFYYRASQVVSDKIQFINPKGKEQNLTLFKLLDRDSYKLPMPFLDTLSYLFVKTEEGVPIATWQYQNMPTPKFLATKSGIAFFSNRAATPEQFFKYLKTKKNEIVV